MTTTLPSPIPLDSTVTSGYTLPRAARAVIQWGSMAIIVLASIVSALGGAFALGAAYQRRITPEVIVPVVSSDVAPDVAFLQSQLIQAYGDNNRAQAAMGAQLDWVDDSAFRTGWYSACVEYRGGSEAECFAWATELIRE